MASAVQSLEVSYFIQMTEDEEKVRKAVTSLVGRTLPEERQEAEGHFGNAIVWVRIRATGEEAEASLETIVSHLGLEERRAVLGDLGAMLDEHSALYIRLSKQVLVMSGVAVLTASDPIRIRVKPRSHAIGGDPERFYGRLLQVSR